MSPAMNTDEGPADRLRRIGEMGDEPLDIAEAALMLSSLDHSGRPLQPYQAHLADIAEHARAEGKMATTAHEAARVLATLLVGRYGYDGDRLRYDDPQNADFITVIDRRRGLPVALGILYIHAARAAGFKAAGLNSPGHFLLRIGLHSGETLIDPFNGGAALERDRLGSPPVMGMPGAEDVRRTEPVSDVDVLLRLENNLKMRALQAGERVRALEIVKRMVLIAPRRPDLWMDLGRMNEASGALGAAQKAFEACLSLVPPGHTLHNEAALGVHALKRRLN
ncbi:MAG TPA: transglutaminase-like domain-containing protein [Rhizomicrobium sp.]|nr:transglutaminase-like domain-containing protein [Rhizomicrobium sp.]